MKRKLLGFFLLIMVICSGCIILERYTFHFAGREMHFRADLNKAKDVNVLYDESKLRELLLDPNGGKIKIAFFNTTEQKEEIPFYYVSTFEFSGKYTTIFKFYAGIEEAKTTETEDGTCFIISEPGHFPERGICLGVLGIEKMEDLENHKDELIILFMGPSTSDETKIEVEENIIKLEASDFSEVDRKYTDLDLLVDKLLLILMNDQQFK